MKRTSRISVVSPPRRTEDEPTTPSTADEQETSESNDAKESSGDVLAEAGKEKPKKPSAKSSLEGPLPDPKETSQAILDHELEAVIRDTYV